VLHEQLRNAWRARERAVCISPAMHFASEGLILGAGTVVFPAEGPRQLRSLQGQEARVLALLSAAYGKAAASSVLGNIERAGKAWSAGDDCLAYIHLAHARLPTLQDPYDAARRLFIVDGFMKAGTNPRVVFEALHFGAAYIDAVEKFFNPDQPRVPAGSGRTSGEWTDSGAMGGDDAARPGTARQEEHGSSLLGRMPLPAASFLGELNAAQAAELGAYALRVLSAAGTAAAVFGLLFIPSPNNIRVEGEVPGIPGLKYSWNRDETELRLTYDSPDGARQTFTAQLQEDVFRNQRGQVVGRVLPQGDIAIELSALPLIPANDNEPKLCPDYSPDRRTNDKGLEYENYIKSIVNPGNPTPSEMGYILPSPSGGGKGVSFDDCEHHTGTMVEIKDGYADFLRTEWGTELLGRLFLAQATRQIEAAGLRPVRWYFSQKQTADFATRIFEKDPTLQNIDIEFKPWPGRGE
jgi:hypothetical protein